VDTSHTDCRSASATVVSVAWGTTGSGTCEARTNAKDAVRKIAIKGNTIQGKARKGRLE